MFKMRYKFDTDYKFFVVLWFLLSYKMALHIEKRLLKIVSQNCKQQNWKTEKSVKCQVFVFHATSLYSKTKQSLKCKQCCTLINYWI